MSIINYVIADDHKIFRQGLRVVFAKDHKLICVGEAGNGNELLELLKSRQVHVALVDLKMPEMDGFEVIAEIRKSNDEKIKIIVLTMFDDEPFIVRMMEGGANGYLLKNADPSDIIMAIHSVYETGYYFSDLVSKTLLRKVVQRDDMAENKSPTISLTAKEIEIMRLICQEYTTAEIGRQVFLSPRTVDGIRAALMEKVGVRNVAGLAVYAIRNGYYS